MDAVAIPSRPTFYPPEPPHIVKAVLACPSRPSEDLFDTEKTKVITLVLGPDGNTRTCQVHESLLRKHSKYFEAALQDVWVEGKNGVVRLREYEADDFKVFAGFVYTGKLHIEREVSMEERFKDLGRAWVLGNGLMSDTYQDAVTDCILTEITVFKCHPSTLHTIIYPKTGGGSAMRRLLVDIAVFLWSNKQVEDLALSAENEDYYHEVVAKLDTMAEGANHYELPWFFRSPDAHCYYHEHGGRQCYRKVFNSLK